jgi:hypothetical protein
MAAGRVPSSRFRSSDRSDRAVRLPKNSGNVPRSTLAFNKSPVSLVIPVMAVGIVTVPRARQELSSKNERNVIDITASRDDWSTGLRASFRLTNRESLEMLLGRTPVNLLRVKDLPRSFAPVGGCN